jgi:hypothetical protein
MSRHGRISGRWPAKELNKVGDDFIKLLGGNILIEAEYKAGKEVQIQLTKAVALENNRGSITAAQKAGQATKTTGPANRDSDSESGSGSDTELANAQLNQQMTPLNQVGVQNPSPTGPRRLQSRVSPQPEPVKKTQKRRALIEDCREVDMGPRKLRSRK